MKRRDGKYEAVAVSGVEVRGLPEKAALLCGMT